MYSIFWKTFPFYSTWYVCFKLPQKALQTKVVLLFVTFCACSVTDCCYYLKCNSSAVKRKNILQITLCWCRPGSSVGIGTGYRLDGPGSNPGGDENFRPSRPALGPTMGTGSFPGAKCDWGLLLTTHPLLVPRSWKNRAIPLPTLWATPGL